MVVTAVIIRNKKNYKKEEKKVIKRILVAALLVAALALPAWAAETSTSGSVGVFSSYVWRGITVHEDIAVQPTVGLTYGGFGANLWADWNADTDEHVETDLTLSYSFSIEKLSLGVGYIYYGLDGFNDTQEFYASAAYDILLSPSLALYWDFDEGEGAFLVASIGHSFELPHEIALKLGASASVNLENSVMGQDSDGEDFSNFYNGELSASLSIPIMEALSIEPKVAYSFSLSDDADNAIGSLSDGGDNDAFYGGATLGLSF
jgi:uncharacterized protein (TIGR02001 family)